GTLDNLRFGRHGFFFEPSRFFNLLLASLFQQTALNLRLTLTFALLFFAAALCFGAKKASLFGFCFTLGSAFCPPISQSREHATPLSLFCCRITPTAKFCNKACNRNLQSQQDSHRQRKGQNNCRADEIEYRCQRPFDPITKHPAVA